MTRALFVLVVLSAILPTATASASDVAAPEIVSVEKIWDQAKYNSFTDLIRFKDRWWCTFREAEEHGPSFGKVRLIVSDDGDTWTSAALLTEEGIDLRDPHLSITPDGRLMCVMGGSMWTRNVATIPPGQRSPLTRSPRIAFSPDGRQWTAPKKVLAEDHWLWRATWHKGQAWSMSKLGEGRDPRRIMLYTSTDGLDWRWVAEPRLPDDTWNGSETTLRFLPDDTMVALTRPEWIGTSRPPYYDWKWTRMTPKRQPGDRTGEIGGPNFIVLPDGSLWGSGRLYGARKKTVLARMTPTSYTAVLDLPSGGDNSYAGMVWHDGLLWMSYYSSHEGKPSIYLAKIRIPAASKSSQPAGQ